MITPLELILAKVIEKSNINANYHFGDENELQRFLTFRDRQKSVRLAYGEIGTVTKYPLIWLVVGNRQPLKKSLYMYLEDEILFENVRLIVSCNTNEEWLNPTRWRNTLLKLEQIENDLKNLFEQNKHLRIYENTWTVFKLPNVNMLQTKEQSTDLWDAVIIDCELRLLTSCLSELDYKNC